MSYLFNHTVFFDGDFRLLTVILILAAIAVVAYCVIRVLGMKKQLKELRETAAGLETADTAVPGAGEPAKTEQAGESSPGDT